MWQGLEGIGWGWIGVAILHVVLFWTLCIALLWVLMTCPANALEVLKVRYAKGELTREEFERLKREVADPQAAAGRRAA